MITVMMVMMMMMMINIVLKFINRPGVAGAVL